MLIRVHPVAAIGAVILQLIPTHVAGFFIVIATAVIFDRDVNEWIKIPFRDHRLTR